VQRTVRVLLALVLMPAVLVAQQIAPPSSGGFTALERALDRLDQNKRVLMIAAHPDDEDTELLALLSRGMGVDAAYLSLSRGEGGQNLIGPELGEQLGLIRTGELLAARSLDGAHQYFSRAFDFGYSKTLDESLRFWPRDTMVADVARIIRRFRPQVIVSVFTGTPRDGHGQHQVSGVVARAAFELLRDSAWGPVKFYESARFQGTPTLTLPDTTLDPLAGKSYLQIAMAGRSLHRSQEMGQLQRLGPSAVRLALVETARGADAAPNGGLFAGVDTSLGPGLARYQALIDSARAIADPHRMGAVVPLLTAALEELRRHAPPAFLRNKEPLLEEAIATAANVVVDAVADDGRVVPGQAVQVGATVWNAGDAAVRTRGIVIEAPAGWDVAPLGTADAPDGGPSFFASGRVPVARFSVHVPPDAELTQPYFLTRPRIGALYDWSGVADSLRGEPLDPPLLEARFDLEVLGVPVTLRREVAYRFDDPAFGEQRKPVIVVPRVGVALSPGELVWPAAAGGQTRRLSVELVHGSRDTTTGFVRLDVPAGWPAVAPQPFTLAGQETRQSFTFDVRAPAQLAPGRYVIRAVAQAGEAGAPAESRASVVIDYPHIRPMSWVADAVTQVTVAPLTLPPVRLVGYVRGAADRVPEALEAVGLPIKVLSPQDLERGDLSAYDVIVIGSRAYETDPALVANNGRLLDYVRAGGRVVVQYQQYPFIQGGFAPYPLSIARPHDRVTDEHAPVTLLDPSDPAFRAPNAIGPADWDDWVQERGLYFAHDWDSAYRPLLEMGDAGERLRGGLLVARYGRGLYTYTGLAFFRQLPAGVPGAYRLFMNLLAMTPDAVP